MIGVFDSGFGGLQTLSYLKDQFPEHNFIFLADSKNAPYGTKDAETIRTQTFKGLNRLFDHGAKIVILACNTASAYSIRSRQELYPQKKVLSVSIPAFEAMQEHSAKFFGILATDATVQSGLYEKKFQELIGNKEKKVSIVAAPDLVTLIEQGEKDQELIKKTIKNYMNLLPKNIECLVLGCTHFPVYLDHFEKIFKNNIINPSREAARKLKSYLSKHSEIEKTLKKMAEILIFTTGESRLFNSIGKEIVSFAFESTSIELPHTM